MRLDHLWWLLAAGFGVATAFWMLFPLFSREARLGRRRRRNHHRLEPKGNHPMVKLSVRTRSKPKR